MTNRHIGSSLDDFLKTEGNAMVVKTTGYLSRTPDAAEPAPATLQPVGLIGRALRLLP